MAKKYPWYNVYTLQGGLPCTVCDVKRYDYVHVARGENTNTHAAYFLPCGHAIYLGAMNPPIEPPLLATILLLHGDM